MIRSLFFCSLFFFASAFAQITSYKVKFLGLDHKASLKTLQQTSDLVLLKKKVPPSLNALRFRVNSDIPKMLQVLHSYGYYDAKLETQEATHKHQIAEIEAECNAKIKTQYCAT